MSSKNYGYCDLCVNKVDLTKLNHIKSLGFHTIAINTLVEETTDEPKKKKKKGEVRDKQDFIPAPTIISEDVRNTTQLNILQRVTIEFSESSVSHKLNQSENLKKYDIIAVIPKSLQAFQYACGTMDIDLITFDPQVRIPFKISRKLYKQAVDRGVFFEIMYSPMLRNSTARKNIISTAHDYYAVGKAKNWVVTSSMVDDSQIRGVYDVINLGFLFGLNSNQSFETVRDNPRKLIIKADGRRTGKLYLKISANEDENKMIE